MKYGDLITVGLKCYNQRGTIGAALEAALCQTYRPLQVAVSDDGSTDGSYELLQERIAARAARDVEVVLLRNETNLGNMGNWLRICAASKGEWIVKADGDDASEPDRVEAIARALDGRTDAYVVSCGGVKVNADGREVGRFKARSAWHPLGACMAFHRACWEKFPEPKDLRNVDDEIFARRALILGDGAEIRIDLPLVRYRVGSGISSSVEDIRATELKCMRMNPRSFAQVREDAEAYGRDVARWRATFDAQEREVALGIALRTAPTFAQRLAAWRQLPGRRITTPYGLKLLIYLLPRRLGDACLKVLSSLRYR